MYRMSLDELFRTRSQGIPAEGLRDPYADGKAAKVFELYIGDKNSRTEKYKTFLIDLLKKNGCKRILDVACGTGIDSVLLLEEGFEVVSVDASDKMLKYAFKTRWDRRYEKTFLEWIIEEANWLSLEHDISHLIGDGFDAIICLGNSFAHMQDLYGDQRDHWKAIENFKRCLKTGGLLLIDHRNYDNIMTAGATPTKCIYYNSKNKTDIRTSVLYVGGEPSLVILDYLIDTGKEISDFRFSYYPHKMENFKKMLMHIFGKESKHDVYGDFKSLVEEPNPVFYIHVVKK